MKKFFKLLGLVTSIGLMSQFSNINTKQTKVKGTDTWRTHLTQTSTNKKTEENIQHKKTGTGPSRTHHS